VSQGPSFLTADRTVGQLGEVEYGLDTDLVAGWNDLNLFPVSLLRVTDLPLVSAPLVAFTGEEALAGGGWTQSLIHIRH
jgi:hypothetical protein